LFIYLFIYYLMNTAHK